MSDSQDSQESITFMSSLLDEETPRNVPLSAKYKKSFAYPSMKDRCPVILSKIVDHLYRDKLNIIQNFGEESTEELKQAIGEVSQLKNALQTGKPMDYFTSGEPDTHQWNRHIRELENKNVKITYYEADWLFTECHLYRKIREIFATKSCLSSFDPFTSSKVQLLYDSIPSILPLWRYFENLEDRKNPQDGKVKKELTLLLKCALWGNRFDLSLKPGSMAIEEDILSKLETLDHYIIVNQMDEAISILADPFKSKKVVAYVLDNSGMELLFDLYLCDFLVTSCGVSEVRFRMKRIPWYVSDVTTRDFFFTIETLKNHEDIRIKKFALKCLDNLKTGLWTVESNTYWCLGLSYSLMPDEDPDLYNALSESDLIIFKGDLNYRKLLQDVNWEPSTSFSEALGSFHPAPLLALRTNKCDLICGLEPGQDVQLGKTDPDWMISGEYAMVQFDSP